VSCRTVSRWNIYIYIYICISLYLHTHTHTHTYTHTCTHTRAHLGADGPDCELPDGVEVDAAQVDPVDGYHLIYYIYIYIYIWMLCTSVWVYVVCV
jgi:hypothetical protein